MTRTLLVSDLHCGSHVGLNLPTVKLDKKVYANPMNIVQRKVLLPFWDELCSSEPFDNIVVDGDLIDGANPKDGGMGVWTTDLKLQAAVAAEAILRIPLKPKGRIDVVEGTGYHGGHNPIMEEIVVTMINSKDKRDYAVAEYHDELDLNIDGLKFNISHKLSNTFYRGTALNRELMWDYIYKHDYIGLIRAHVHQYHRDDDGKRFAISLPGWKLRDRYAKSFGLKFIAQIGWAVLTVEDGEWDIRPRLRTMKNDTSVVKL